MGRGKRIMCGGLLAVVADARPNYTDANPIFTGGAARHRDALRRAGPSASAAAPYLKHVRGCM